MDKVLSVSEINKYIKEIFANDLILPSVWVKGEISNYKFHYSGHMYFTIKDNLSILKCVMFKSQNSSIKFTPENGMKVIVRGSISVFERDGQYQLYAVEMQPDGIGNLHVAFEQLKLKLDQEGLFQNKYKKKLPVLPSKIGVITSSTGSVIKDILNVLNRRYSNIEIKLFPVAVQGELAAAQISNAIIKFNKLNNVEVIILARGGGSLEELWAFNEELVARSIFASDIPIISAIGHETDFTIADFVADLRAPTPSAAAELVIPEKRQLKEKISELEKRLKNLIRLNLAFNRRRLAAILNNRAFKQPFNEVFNKRHSLELLNKDIVRAINNIIKNYRNRTFLNIEKLDMLSPLSTLTRGYSIVRNKKTDTLIKSINDVENKDIIEINLSDGIIIGTVDKIEKVGLINE